MTTVARGHRTGIGFLAPWLWVILLAEGGFAAQPIERLALFDAAETKGWSVAESTLESSGEKAPDGSPVLHWHVTVDHMAGEPNYPIGWPRFGRAIADARLRDWSAWDSLHLWLRADSTRPALPREPIGLGLQAPDKASSFQRPLSELKKGEWVELEIPVRDIPGNGDVRQIQFHIAEAKYKHGDQLDLLLAMPELRRPARPTLLEFSPECAVMYADAPQIPLHVRVAGVKPGQLAHVVIALSRDGKSLIGTAKDLGRGDHRVEIGARDARLDPGVYEIEACIAGDDAKKTGSLRMVESPWAK